MSFKPCKKVTHISPADVSLEHIHTGETEVLKDIDNTILVTSRPPAEGLYQSLVGQVSELHVIGDARESRWSVFATDEAIKDGRRVGLLL